MKNTFIHPLLSFRKFSLSKRTAKLMMNNDHETNKYLFYNFTNCKIIQFNIFQSFFLSSHHVQMIYQL